MMQASVILWKVSLSVIDCMPVAVLVVAQVAALLILALCVWLPFRWWFATTSAVSPLQNPNCFIQTGLAKGLV